MADVLNRGYQLRLLSIGGGYLQWIDQLEPAVLRRRYDGFFHCCFPPVTSPAPTIILLERIERVPRSAFGSTATAVLIVAETPVPTGTLLEV